MFCRSECESHPGLTTSVTAKWALAGGLVPCPQCSPLSGESDLWASELVDEVESQPIRRWKDHHLRTRGLSPTRVRSWFQHHHGLTFHGYARSRRLTQLMTRLKAGPTDGRSWLSEDPDGGPTPEATGTAKGDVIVLSRLETPLGPMVAGATDDGICLLEFADRRMLESQLKRLTQRLAASFVRGAHRHINLLSEQLAAYFTGQLTVFEIPLVLEGTPIQRRVWEALLQVPYGSTTSYGALSELLGDVDPGAVRKANGDNRLAILVPCHRVIQADGSLAGYGGGLERKQQLLDLERGA